MKTSTKYLKFFLNLIGIVLGLFLLVYLGGKLFIFFLPFVIGWVIALIANPLVRFLEKRLKIVRKHSSIIIIVLVLGAIIGLSYLAIGKASQQIGRLVEEAPNIYASVSQDFAVISNKLNGVFKGLPEGLQSTLDGVKENISYWSSDFLQNLSKPTVDAAKNFVKYLPTLFVMIIFTILSAYFFVADRDKILEWGRANTPKVIRSKWQLIVGSFQKAFGGYFKAQLKIMIVIYGILLLGLALVKVEFAILIAFLIAFLDMLPFFGTGTILVPWAVFQFLAGDTKRAIYLLILYGVTQVVHHGLQPKLVGDSVGINPLYALILMYIGFKFSGVLGMIIAVPIGMILKNFYQAGAFDTIIDGFKMLAEDIRNFMKT